MENMGQPNFGDECKVELSKREEAMKNDYRCGQLRDVLTQALLLLTRAVLPPSLSPSIQLLNACRVVQQVVAAGSL
jgi:hypothetical protein